MESISDHVSRRQVYLGQSPLVYISYSNQCSKHGVTKDVGYILLVMHVKDSMLFYNVGRPAQCDNRGFLFIGFLSIVYGR